jgi:hypothetical protein
MPELQHVCDFIPADGGLATITYAYIVRSGTQEGKLRAARDLSRNVATDAVSTGISNRNRFARSWLVGHTGSHTCLLNSAFDEPFSLRTRAVVGTPAYQDGALARVDMRPVELLQHPSHASARNAMRGAQSDRTGRRGIQRPRIGTATYRRGASNASKYAMGNNARLLVTVVRDVESQADP